VNPWMALLADAHRMRGASTLKAVLASIVTCRTFRALASMRLCQAAASSSGALRLLLPAARLLHRSTTRRAGMDLPWSLRADGGLSLIHGWGLVAHPNVKIGKNVTLLHGVTLGRRDKISPTGERLIEYPTIEDDVWVGPHAIIVGGVTIGRGSRIAGGAFVTESVPPHSVVTGNPSSVTRTGCTPDVVNPAPAHRTP